MLNRFHRDPRSAAAGGSNQTVVIAPCLVLALSLLGFSVNRGLGLTDEAFYVDWIADPARYDATIQTFGLPLHLVFVAFGRSLIALRLFGIALLLVSGAVLGRSLSRYYGSRGHPLPGSGLTMLGALFSLSYFALWILTPSYNLLANAGGALMVAGALEWDIADRHDAPRRFGRAAMLVGIGGFLSFFGKPPLAAVGAVGIATMVWRSVRRHGPVAMLPALATAASFCLVPVVASIALPVGLGAFARSLAVGTQVLRFRNSLFMMPVRTWREFFTDPILAMSVTIALLAFALPATGEGGRRDWRSLRLTFMALIAFVMLYASRLLLDGLRSELLPWSFIGLPAACVALTFFALGPIRGTRAPLSIGALLPLWVLLALPFATATGTANNLINQIGASIYPFLFVLVVAVRLYWPTRTARATEIGTALFTVATLLCSFYRPYGLAGSVLAQTRPIRVGFTHDTLLVTPQASAYADDLARLAANNGLTPATPIIDLSSGGPGTVMLLGGRSPFFPWLLPNTDVPGLIIERAWQSLDDAQKRGAWIIGPIDPRLAATAPARWLAAHRRCYRAIGPLRATFWRDTQPIVIWLASNRTARATC